MSILEGGGWKSLSPSTSTTICSIHLHLPLCPYSSYIRCAVPAHSTVWIIYFKGTRGALAINMRISALPASVMCRRAVGLDTSSAGKSTPISRPGQTEIRGQEKIGKRSAGVEGGGNRKGANGKEGKHQKFKALTSNFSFHWDTAQSSGQTTGLARPI